MMMKMMMKMMTEILMKMNGEKIYNFNIILI